MRALTNGSRFTHHTSSSVLVRGLQSFPRSVTQILKPFDTASLHQGNRTYLFRGFRKVQDDLVSILPRRDTAGNDGTGTDSGGPVRQLHAQGQSVRRISREPHISRQAVRRALGSPQPPRCQRKLN